MTREVIDAMFERYKEHLQTRGPSKYNQLIILGGEPLLHMNRVKYMVTLFQSASCVPSVVLDTNTVLLDREIAGWCLEKNVYLQISVNDLPVKYFENKMKILSKVGCNWRVSMVLTEQNLNRLQVLLEKIYNYTDRANMRHQYGNRNPNYHLLYETKILEAYRWLLDTNRIFNPERFFESMSVTWRKGEAYRHACGVCNFPIDPDGNVGWCPRHDDFIGNVLDPEFDFCSAMENAALPKLHYEGIPECEDCEFKMMCGGGCPSLKLMEQYMMEEIKKLPGTMKRIYKPSPFCSTNKKVLPLLLEMKHRRGV